MVGICLKSCQLAKRVPPPFISFSVLAGETDAWSLASPFGVHRAFGEGWLGASTPPSLRLREIACRIS